MIEILRRYIEGALKPSEASSQIMALYGEESPYNSPACILRMMEYPREKRCGDCPSLLSCQKQAAVILALMSLDKCQLQLIQSEETEALQRATEGIRKTIELILVIANAKTEGEIKSLL